MAITGKFYFEIEDGLIGQKLYGGTVEWNDNLTIRENIVQALEYDSTTGLFNWDFDKMPSLQSLIPTALANVSNSEWRKNASGGRSWQFGTNTNCYIRMQTSSSYYPIEDNPLYPAVGYGDFNYALTVNFPMPYAVVFHNVGFSQDGLGSITGYDVEHTIPLQTFNETNGYDDGQTPPTPHMRYYTNPNLSPSGLLMFWETVDDVPTPKYMFYVEIQRQENLVGIANLRYWEMSHSIYGDAIFEEEEEDMRFPNSYLCNFFTTMYAMTFGQIEGLAKYLTNPKEGSSSASAFLQELLDDMGFQTGVVTDAILDMTVWPFSIPLTVRGYGSSNGYDVSRTRYLKLGYGNDKTNLGPEAVSPITTEPNLGILYYDPTDPGNTSENTTLYKMNRLNTVPLTIPSNGSISFDGRITRFNDFRDYPPYRTFEMYVPFVGTVPVDQRKLYGKNILLRYIPDFYTGNGTCLLLSDDGGGEYSVLESWDCVLGVHQAVTATNWAEYASRMNSARSMCMPNPSNIYTNQINTNRIARQPIAPSKDVLSRAISMQNKKTSIEASKSMGNVISTNFAMEAVGSGISHAQSEISNQGVFTGNVNGTSSASNNYFMPLHWYIIDYQQESHITANLSSLMGRASNTSANLSTFSGFLQVKAVELNCPQATEAEKAKILSMLETGIRI